jgi:EamA-like transporter family
VPDDVAHRGAGYPALAACALLLASVLWGGAITGTKHALRAFDPVTLLGVGLAAATAALWAVLLIRDYRPPPSWPAAVLLGLLEPALAYLGETFGLSMTSATDGAIISGLESALVVILAALVLGEAISRAGIVAVVACLAGLVVLTGCPWCGRAIRRHRPRQPPGPDRRVVRPRAERQPGARRPRGPGGVPRSWPGRCRPVSTPGRCQRP